LGASDVCAGAGVPGAAAGDREEVARQPDALLEERTRSGELVAGPAHTRTFRGCNGVPLATDGPFLESKEQLAAARPLLRSHPRGRVWHEERHGFLPAWPVRPVYRALIAPIRSPSARGGQQARDR
jgi:hypothetical protein